jgi:hypothetical protein
MGFYGSPCHLEFGGDFGVVTTLQKQFNNLLLARTEPNGLFIHLIHLLSVLSALTQCLTFSQNYFWSYHTARPIDYQSLESTRVGRHRTSFATGHCADNLASGDSNEQVSI